MSEPIESSFKVDRLELYVRRWPVPSGTEPKGKIAFVHGFSEHMNVYNDWFPYFAEAGYEVVGFDQRGAGKTSPRKKDFGNTNEYHTFHDLETFLAAEAKGYEGKFFLWGHSMGGAIVLNYGVRGDLRERVDGYIANAPLITLSRDIAPGWFLRKLINFGARYMPGYKQKAQIPVEHLTPDVEKQKAYRLDPLRRNLATAEMAHDYIERGKRLTSTVFVDKFIDRPVLVNHGTNDKMCDVNGSRKFFELLKVTDKKLNIYEGAPHELQQQLKEEREKHRDDVLEWLNAHAEGPSYYEEFIKTHPEPEPEAEPQAEEETDAKEETTTADQTKVETKDETKDENKAEAAAAGAAVGAASGLAAGAAVSHEAGETKAETATKELETEPSSAAAAKVQETAEQTKAAETAAETAAEPAQTAEPVTEPVAETAAEPVTETATEPTTEAVEPATETAAEPATEAAAETAIEPSTAAAAKVEETAEQTKAAETTTETAAEPTTEPTVTSEDVVEAQKLETATEIPAETVTGPAAAVETSATSAANIEKATVEKDRAEGEAAAAADASADAADKEPTTEEGESEDGTPEPEASGTNGANASAPSTAGTSASKNKKKKNKKKKGKK